MTTAGNDARRRGALRVLSIFFRTAAVTSVLVSFSFEVNSSGVFHILWRDNLPLAATLVGLGLLMAGAAMVVSRLLRAPSNASPETFAAPGGNPYDIWHAMPTRARIRLALTVFPIFAAVGPILGMMDGSTFPLRLLEAVVMTLASGGMAASIILFGNRPLVLVLSFLVCMAASQNSGPIADAIVGPAVHAAQTGGALSFTAEQWQAISSRRQLLGIGAIALISLGYTLFVILLASEGRRRTRLETEMGIARGIQNSLLPAAGLSTPWCNVAGMTLPATEVGGDYFDYLELSDGRVAVVVADVAGHGVGAGILSAMTKSSFRTLVAADPLPLPLLRELNRTLCQLVQRNYFVTMAYMLLDPAKRTARIATAGHPPVLHFRGEEVTRVRTPSMGLGMNKSALFAEEEISWNPGDSFLFYTDGVLEARDAHGEEYGEGRLRESIKKARARNSGELPGALVASLREHASTFADDVTLVSVTLA
jgi:hypothetical protein